MSFNPELEAFVIRLGEVGIQAIPTNTHGPLIMYVFQGSERGIQAIVEDYCSPYYDGITTPAEGFRLHIGMQPDADNAKLVEIVNNITSILSSGDLKF